MSWGGLVPGVVVAVLVRDIVTILVPLTEVTVEPDAVFTDIQVLVFRVKLDTDEGGVAGDLNDDGFVTRRDVPLLELLNLGHR